MSGSKNTTTCSIFPHQATRLSSISPCLAPNQARLMSLHPSDISTPKDEVLLGSACPTRWENHGVDGKDVTRTSVVRCAVRGGASGFCWCRHQEWLKMAVAGRVHLGLSPGCNQKPNGVIHESPENLTKKVVVARLVAHKIRIICSTWMEKTT